MFYLRRLPDKAFRIDGQGQPGENPLDDVLWTNDITKAISDPDVTSARKRALAYGLSPGSNCIIRHGPKLKLPV